MGFHKGAVPKLYFEDIWNKLELADIRNLSEHYRIFITDASTIELKINYDNNATKHIESYAGAGTTELKWLLNTLYNFGDKVNIEEN